MLWQVSSCESGLRGVIMDPCLLGEALWWHWWGPKCVSKVFKVGPAECLLPRRGEETYIRRNSIAKKLLRFTVDADAGREAPRSI